MAVGLPLKTTYADGDVYSASDVNDTNGTVNLFQTSTLSYQAGKNRAINGGMDVWQRGTSFSVAANTSAYTADRWSVRTTQANMANTVSRQTVSDTTNLPTIQYCARVQRNLAQTGANFLIFEQGFETVNSIPLAGQTVTLSFYARAGANFSAASSTLVSSIVNGTGTDQMPGVYTGGNYPTQNNTLTTTWKRFTQTLTIPTTATEVGIQLYYTTVGVAGAADYFEITGVQLELGSTATTFSRAGGDIQGELAACQRYYQKKTLGATGACYDGTNDYFNILLLVSPTMRVSPTLGNTTTSSVQYVNTAGSLANTNSILTAGSNSTDSAFIIPTVSALGTTGQAAAFSLTAITFSSEL
jgi:hypothetical protein